MWEIIPTFAIAGLRDSAIPPLAAAGARRFIRLDFISIRPRRVQQRSSRTPVMDAGHPLAGGRQTLKYQGLFALNGDNPAVFINVSCL